MPKCVWGGGVSAGNLGVVQVDTDFIEGYAPCLEEFFFLFFAVRCATFFNFGNLLLGMRVCLGEECEVFVLFTRDAVVFLGVAEVHETVCAVEGDSAGELYGVWFVAVVYVEGDTGGVALFCEAAGEVFSSEVHDSMPFRWVVGWSGFWGLFAELFHVLGDFGEFVVVGAGVVFAFCTFEGEDISGFGGDEVRVDDVFALAGEDDGHSILVFVGVCVFDGGVIVGVECECVVLDVFKGDVCVQGDADAVFVEVFEVLHCGSLSVGGLRVCWLECFSQSYINMVSH